jgi:hypothetical protein
MAHLAGVTTERNPAGQITMLHIDVTKYAKLMQPVLENLGLVEDEFDKKFKTGITKDELAHDVKTYLKSLPWKK